MSFILVTTSKNYGFEGRGEHYAEGVQREHYIYVAWGGGGGGATYTCRLGSTSPLVVSVVLQGS